MHDVEAVGRDTMRINSLKAKLRAGHAAVGSLVSVAEPFIAEVMGAANFDFLIVDTEHCPLSIHQLQTVLIALRSTDSTVLVRAKGNDTTDIKQILDVGADGVIIPNVSDRTQCAAAVAATKYPPVGIRGFGPRRAGRIAGGAATYASSADDQVVVIVMVEQREALENLDEILSTPGLDAIMVGPADLAVSLGYLHDLSNPAVDAAIEQVLHGCKKHSVPFGIFTGSAERAERWITRGAQLATIGGDVPFIDEGIERARQDISRILGRP